MRIKVTIKKFLVSVFLAGSLSVYSQTGLQLNNLKPDPEKERKFLPYLAVRHGGMNVIEDWKKNNTLQYYKELWYYTESFYVKRDHLNEGYILDESNIDITRFESSRKQNEEFIVVLPGFKDALVLLPANKLVYKP
jgi:hypothetical protein